MKLLFLIHRLPCPPDRGSKLRAAMMLQWLAARHDVWCAGYLDVESVNDSREQVQASLAYWRSICREVVAVPLSAGAARVRAAGRLMAGGTATSGYFETKALRNEIGRLAAENHFDAVHAFSSSMSDIALSVPAKRHVLTMDDLDSLKWLESASAAKWPMRWVYETEGRRLQQCEVDWIRRFDATVLVSEREARQVCDPQLRRRVHVVQAGNPLLIEDAIAAGEESFRRSAQHEIVGFLGAMDYQPNIDAVHWFADEIWPQILDHRPEARWMIVGRSPVRSIRDLHDRNRICVTGTVPSVQPYLKEMRVNVAPLRLARGVQIKVLTAMAAGLPCVVTPCVAEGVGACDGQEILVADSAERIARSVIELLSNQSRAETIGQAARSFILRRQEVDAGLQTLESLLIGGSDCDMTPGAGRCQTQGRSTRSQREGQGAFDVSGPVAEIAAI